jgi:hypothetical protein
MRFADRPAVPFLAFAAALLAAAITLALGSMAPDSDQLERIRFFAAAFLATGYGPAIALLGAIVGSIAAVMLRIRSVIYYVIAGGLTGLAAALSVDLSEALENTTDIPPIGFPLALAAVAGIVGGLAFWAIAGRRFGGQAD